MFGIPVRSWFFNGAECVVDLDFIQLNGKSFAGQGSTFPVCQNVSLLSKAIPSTWPYLQFEILRVCVSRRYNSFLDDHDYPNRVGISGGDACFYVQAIGHVSYSSSNELSVVESRELHLPILLGLKDFKMILRVTTAQLQLLSDYYCWKDYADRDEIKD
ncbi:hypothetical protein Tco_0941571 [Tanacetum coccineum]|uniref:Uncharacterized protein n=1 Tax=Tanacetum coccineum TaxID=301880 RepID=A0ABQ5DR95_9ASTR